MTKHEQLIENTRLAEYDCAWCGARKGIDVHSRACPVGERYQQIQRLGGVPWPKGKPLMSRSDFRRTRDYRAYSRRREPGFTERAAEARQRADEQRRLKAFVDEYYEDRAARSSAGL